MARHCHILVCALAACSGSDDVSSDLAIDLAQIDGGAVDQPTITGAPPAIDGVFEDWSGIAELATDPEGDATGAFDLSMVKATSRGTQMYLMFDIGKTLNLQAGAPGDGSLLLELGLPQGKRLTIDFRAHLAYADGDIAKRFQWAQINYRHMPTFAAETYELALDLGPLGVKSGDEVTINFSGSDVLDAPAKLSLAPSAFTTPQRSPDRAAQSAFRLASLNTLFDGLTDTLRRERVGRLIKAVAADIYCLQETINGTASQIAAAIQTVDPHGDGAAWNVHRSGILAIASREPLTPGFSSESHRFTSVGLTVAGKKLWVVNVQPESRGHIGSLEDKLRVSAMQALAASLKSLREGKLEPALLPFKDAPVLVVGDWNLVGSRIPLDVMLDPKGPALTEWPLQHLASTDIFTWRSDEIQTYSPGRLDLLVYSEGSLEPRAGFVLDTEEIDTATRTKLGVDAQDSQASDHLMLVADYDFK